MRSSRSSLVTQKVRGQSGIYKTMLRKRRKDNNILWEISSYLDFIWYLIILLSVVCVLMFVSFPFFQVSFIQNLVFCVERVYRVPDFGVWERGSKYNNGSTELHSRYFPSFKGIFVLFKCVDLNMKLQLQSIKLDLLLILVQLVFLSVIQIGFTFNTSNVLGIIDRCLKGARPVFHSSPTVQPSL